MTITETALTLTDSPSWLKTFNFVILKISDTNVYALGRSEKFGWIDIRG